MSPYRGGLSLLLTLSCVVPTPAQKAEQAEAAYTAAHVKCAATETSREAVDECRAKVRRAWGKP